MYKAHTLYAKTMFTSICCLVYANSFEIQGKYKVYVLVLKFVPVT